MEGASPRGGSALSPAAVGGRRLKTGKKLRLVKKTTVRKLLAKKGLRMRGGAEAGVATDEAVKEDGETVKAASVLPAMGGRRRRTAKKAGRRKSRRGLFGKLF